MHFRSTHDRLYRLFRDVGDEKCSWQASLPIATMNLFSLILIYIQSIFLCYRYLTLDEKFDGGIANILKF